METSFPTVAIIFLGLVGVVCAFAARQQLHGELGPLNRLKGFFADGKGPLHSLEPDKKYLTRPAEWLRDQQIPLESHAADHLLGVWGGWLAGRLPTLGELHSLSARRERGRSSARWATGVAAVLLVCGVAGTLLAIHPVLDRFTIQINPDGTVQDAAKSAERVMAMIHQLGNSFYPSIWAIGFTLGIVFVRSGYHRAAFHLGRELDRFTVDSLLPAFRLPTLGEEFADTQARLSSLADAVIQRDTNFAAAVKSLAEIVKDIRAAGPELSKAAKEVAAAATRLSTDTVGIVNGLAKHLSADGALVKSISGFKESVSRNQDAAKALAGASKKLEDTTRTLSDAVRYVPGALEQGCAEGITRFTDRAKEAATSVGHDVAAAVDRAAAPLGEATAELRQASAELQTNSRAAKAEIAAAANESEKVLRAAAGRVEGSAEAAIARLSGLPNEGTVHTAARASHRFPARGTVGGRYAAQPHLEITAPPFTSAQPAADQPPVVTESQNGEHTAELANDEAASFEPSAAEPPDDYTEAGGEAVEEQPWPSAPAHTVAEVPVPLQADPVKASFFKRIFGRK